MNFRYIVSERDDFFANYLYECYMLSFWHRYSAHINHISNYPMEEWRSVIRIGDLGWWIDSRIYIYIYVYIYFALTPLFDWFNIESVPNRLGFNENELRANRIIVANKMHLKFARKPIHTCSISSSRKDHCYLAQENKKENFLAQFSAERKIFFLFKSYLTRPPFPLLSSILFPRFLFIRIFRSMKNREYEKTRIQS